MACIPRAILAGALATMLHLACLGAAWAGETPWPVDAFNPQAAEGDLVLPMPCGGAMAFRPVIVPGKDILDDRRIMVGTLEEDVGFKENQRAEYIAGGFTDKKSNGQRLYYIGKYEVTVPQFASFSGTCPKLDDNVRQPKTNVTWTEVMGFADAYSQWLRAKATGKLPEEEGLPGFLRLPTEDEWDYAARGGSRVSDADFSARLFPMAEPMASYVQYGGPDSSNNELQWVGLLKPNPLGIHDILGNAGELVFDLFRLSRVTRPHGQAGGYVVRGGDYLTSQSAMRTSARDEFPPYDAEGPRRQPTVGFRLVIVAPVLPTPGRVKAVQAAWHDLPADIVAAVKGASLPEVAQNDPLKELDNLSGAVADPALQKRLQELRNVMAGSIATRNEQRDRAARATLNLATYLAANLRFDTQKVLAIEEVAALGNAQSKERLPNDIAALRSGMDYYRNTLRLLINDYPPRIRADQLRVLEQELKQSGANNQLAAISVVRDHLADLEKAGELPSDRLETQFRKDLCRTGAATRYPTACKAIQ